MRGWAMRGAGRSYFVATLLLIAGVINSVYGIAAISNSKIWAGETRFVFSDLHTWGWITLIIGVVQIIAAFSLYGGQTFGVVVGIFAATIGAIGALMDVGGAHPWWALGVFALCVICLKGLLAFGSEAHEVREESVGYTTEPPVERAAS